MEKISTKRFVLLIIEVNHLKWVIYEVFVLQLHFEDNGFIYFYATYKHFSGYYDVE